LPDESDFALPWVPLALSLISCEVFDVRLGGLTLLTKIISSENRAKAAAAMLLSLGFEAILSIPLHAAFNTVLPTISGFLAEQDLLTIESLTPLWNSQNVQDQSLLDVFFSIFESIGQHLIGDFCVPFTDLILSPPARMRAWMTLVSRVAVFLRDCAECAGAFGRLRAVLRDIALSQDDVDQCRSVARSGLLQVICAGQSDEDLCTSFECLVYPLTPFSIDIAEAIGRAMRKLSAEMQRKLSEVAVVAIQDRTCELAGFRLLSSLVTQRTVSLTKDLLQAIAMSPANGAFVKQLIASNALPLRDLQALII
jgi:hypothetical protein